MSRRVLLVDTRRVLLVDTETTSLSPQTGEIWELAIIDRTNGTEHLWRVRPDLAKADPGALRVNRFYERTAGMKARDTLAHDLAARSRPGGYWSHGPALAETAAKLLDDAVIVAANPAFDAGFLTAFLNAHGQAATWHYRLRDIGSMAWGWLQANGVPPAIDASTDQFAEALGLDANLFGRHSALGDCRLLAAMMNVIEGAP